MLSSRNQSILGGLVVLLLLIYSILLNLKTSQRKYNTLAVGQTYNPLDLPANFNGVVVLANVTFIDTLKESCTLRYQFIFTGTWASSSSSSEKVLDFSTPSSPILFVSGQSRTVLDSSLILLPAFEIEYKFDLSYPVYYPFDSYVVSGLIFSLYNNSDTLQEIPVAFGLTAAKQSWSSTSIIDDWSTSKNHIEVTVTFFRSWTTKLFACFISFLLWMISLALVTVAYYIWVDDSIAESGMMRLSVSVLYALPKLRSAQPGLPILGVTEDVASFFFCIILTALCSIMLLTNFMRYNVFHDNANSGPIYQEWEGKEEEEGYDNLFSKH